MRLLILLGGQVFSGAEITTLRFAEALSAKYTVEVAAHPAVMEQATAFGLQVYPWTHESAPGDTLLRASHFIDEPCAPAAPGRAELEEIIARFKPDTALACMFPVAMLALPVLKQSGTRLFVHHQLMYKDIPDHPIVAPVRRVADYAEFIIAASHAVKLPLNRSGIRRVKVIPAGLPAGYGQLRHAGIRSTPRLLAMATWGPQKGLETLLEADRILRVENLEYDLTIAGPLNAYDTDYEKQIRTLAHEDVCFTGNHPNPEPCYRNADLLVVPSSEPDPYPTVTLEGMAHGLAVVATDCGGLGEQVVHGETGLLVKPGDATTMADALMQLIRSPGKIHEMGCAGLERVNKIGTLSLLQAEFETLLLN